MNTTNFNSELNIIYTIGKNNGYDTITLEKIFRKINRKFIISKFFTLSNAKHGRKYWNRSRGKLDFKGSSGKNYGTHGLN